MYVGLRTVSLTVAETLLYYTITITIVGDLSVYLVHFLMHKVSFLWEFHKIHHAATSLNPITQYRIHPAELIINNARGIIVFGLITGLFDYLSNHQINMVTFIGVNAFSFVFLLLGANLRHSHVRLKYWNWVEYIFISPFQHQIHHSDKLAHFNKNLGSKLALWDWIFGTLLRSKQVTTVKFGLRKENSNYHSFLDNLLRPLKNGWLFIKRKI